MMQDKGRVIEPILAQPKRSAARAAAFRNVAAVPHGVCGKVERFAENSMRDWVRGVEGRGDASLFPTARKDKGAGRCLIARHGIRASAWTLRPRRRSRRCLRPV